MCCSVVFLVLLLLLLRVAVVVIEEVTIAYKVSIDQQYGYGVCCKLVLKYYDYILLLLFVMFICVFSKLVSAVNC